MRKLRVLKRNTDVLEDGEDYAFGEIYESGILMIASDGYWTL